MKLFFSLLAVLVWAAPVQAQAQARKLPIFDTHMHYSRGAWDVYTPAQILEKLDKAGVSRALVSSRPDDGTLRLLAAAPNRIVAGFRPYINSSDLGTWFENPDRLVYSKARLARGLHRGFGEVHLYSPDNLDAPEMDEYLELIAKHGLILQPHADAAVVRALFAKAPGLKILWAHAGFFEPAPVVGRMLDKYPNLWTEMSYRAADVIGRDGLDGEWKALLIRHADRFMIGTDTWVVDRWHEYAGLIGEHRLWLDLLPPRVAEMIAYGNAERMFGAGR